jgi:hypothetical protein
MLVGAIHGMSASATIQPSASALSSTPHARLAPMPSAARSHATTRAPVAASACSSIVSRGRTIATTSFSAAIMCIARPRRSRCPR